MRRFLTPALGGIALVAAVIFAACLGSSDEEKQAPEGSASAALLMMDAGYSTECPWTSDTDPTCAPGYSEKPCGSGSGRCRVSGSLGCTCVSGTTSLDAGTTTSTSTETTGTTSPDAGYSTECPWTSDTDPSCAPGVSERSCGGGSGHCRVSGSLGCTCVSGTVSLDAGTAL